MSRYRKIEVRTWADEKFCGLSPMPPSGQGLWLFLMTGPNTGPIPGLFRAGRAGMAEELGWELKAFDEAFAEVSEQGMAKADFKARLVWLPKALKHNKPESPNVVRSWRVEFDLLPECDLKREAVAALRAHLETVGPSYVEAFDEFACSPEKGQPKPSTKASGKPSPNQEQEQEQEQKQEQGEAPRKRVAPTAVQRPDEVDEQTWADWLDLRKRKRAPVTRTVVEGARAEAGKAGMPLEQFLRVWCTLGWQGLTADRIRPEHRAAQSRTFAERDREAGMQRWEEMTGRVHPDRQQKPGVVIDMPPTNPIAIGG